MTDTCNIWVIDDDRSIRWVLERTLKQADINVRTFDNADTILKLLESEIPDAIISDVRMPGIDGLQLLEMLGERYPDLPVIIMTAHSDLDSAVSAYQGGAFEYLPKPFDVDEAMELVNRAVQHSRTLRDTTTNIPDDIASNSSPEIIGEAVSMQEVFRAIGRLSRSKITVLINGESGTGKELVARALHNLSRRAKAPMISVNCAAIPETLIESELFGHEKGAFTGASAGRAGLVEAADGGTLFLDEIGELPLEAQARLLRVLQEGEIRRVGSVQSQKVDVRLIAATHRDLKTLAKTGQFREDLYFRLNVFSIEIPPLRERPEDIAPLVHHLLTAIGKKLRVHPIPKISGDVLAKLEAYSWPGNTRELANILETSVILGHGHELELPANFGDDAPMIRDEIVQIPTTLDSAIRQAIEGALRVSGAKIYGADGAARALGLHPATLQSKMRKLGISRTEFLSP